MNTNLTELVFILDKSGSMQGLEKDTVGGFNSMLEKQKKCEGDALVSAVLFNHDFSRVYDRESLKEIRSMTEADYTVGGCTALIDAMGEEISYITTIHKYIREEDRPVKTVFVIITDGMENASHKYDSDTVKKMVEEKRREGWEFIFLGANIDAVETAKRYGIPQYDAVEYRCDAEGTAINFDAVGSVIKSVRANGSVPSGWKKKVEQHKNGKK